LSTLTKVFVVLLVFTSIAVTTVAVSISAQTTNWKKSYQSMEQRSRIADAQIRSLNAATAAQFATLRDTINKRVEEVNRLRSELQANEDQSNSLRLQLKQAVADRASADAMNRGLLGQLQASEKNGQAHRQQRDETEAHNLELERRNVDLNERINEETSRIAVLLEQRRQFEQQINILKKANEGLAQKAKTLAVGSTLENPAGAALQGVTAQTPVAGIAIRGKVVEVSGDIVTISLGSADGVKTGMVFVIRRQGDYVGDLQISVVEPDQSAGRLIRTVKTPLSQDQVIDLSHLASGR